MEAHVDLSTAFPRDWLDELVHLDRDPRTAGWWSTGFIAVPAALVIYTVATSIIVPLAMADRKTRLPTAGLVIPYNGFMCAAHALIGTLLLVAYRGSGRSFVCQDRSFESSAASTSILNLMWLFLGLKELSMFDALIMLSGFKERRITNAVLLNGFLSVSMAWWFLRYGADGHGVPGVVLLCLVDALTYAYYLSSMLGPGVISVVRAQRINVSRLQLLGTAAAWAHYFVALIAECRNPGIFMLVGFGFVGLRFVRLFDFYTEKFVLNGMRLGLDWSIIAGMLENCCFAQANPNGQLDDEDSNNNNDYSSSTSEYSSNSMISSSNNSGSSSSTFRNGFSGPINKPKRG